MTAFDNTALKTNTTGSFAPITPIERGRTNSASLLHQFYLHALFTLFTTGDKENLSAVEIIFNWTYSVI